MPWFPNYMHRENSALSEAALLAVGKALYLCNDFEPKCTHVLSIAEVTTLIEKKPDTPIFEAFDTFKAKLLGPTIKGLKIHVKDKDINILDEARSARNYIAHRGAILMISVSDWIIFAKLNRLRKEVTTLTHGLNLIALWCYEIENKECGPRGFFEEYPNIVDNWIFKDLDELMKRFNSHPEVIRAEKTLAEYDHLL